MSIRREEAQAAMSPRWYFYRDTSGAWRWDAVDGNGDLRAQSGESFEHRAACVANAKAHGYGMSCDERAQPETAVTDRSCAAL